MPIRIVTLIISVSSLLLAACATPGDSATASKAPLTKQQAHVICYQQMQAARAGSMNVTPNRHQYVMCMKARGFDV